MGRGALNGGAWGGRGWEGGGGRGVREGGLDFSVCACEDDKTPS